jgi:magnesium transporter
MSKLFEPFQTLSSLLRSPAKEIGLPPGTLVHVGKQKMDRSIISMVNYAPDFFASQLDVGLEDCTPMGAVGVTWVNVDGVHDVSMIESLGKIYGIHTLALEDILNTGHPPKFEEFETSVLIIMKMFYFDEDSSQIRYEQISIVLTDTTVLTFKEQQSDAFKAVEERLRRQSGKIRQRGSDYLMYALLDSIVDSYFHVLGKIGDRLDLLESRLIQYPTKDLLQEIYQIKVQLMFFRKAAWPVRELLSSLRHSESTLLKDTTDIFLRDLFDHGKQVMDLLEGYRDSAAALLDLYMSSVSQRTNEIMQVLTITASIFIPLTFIAGIYGMNFKLMPELSWHYGYPLVLGLMFVCVIVMLLIFKRKKWF